MHFNAESKPTLRVSPGWGLADKSVIGNNFRAGEIEMILRISRLALGGALVVVAMTGTARAGLSEAERITLDQPACAQMKAFSRDITLINDEMQNMRRFGTRRLCEVLGRSITTISNTVDYMRSHIGECTITDAKIDDLFSSQRKLEGDRRKICR
ncbi:MAG: hypothetical protein JWR80_4335 [Bradyrhizobium sp.]|nr:hypothetical protein [Bradyrhizobium sp.]